MTKFFNLIRMLDKAVIRNYALFCFILIFGAGGLTYILISGGRTIAKIDDQVTHTYSVINNAQELSTFVEGMLAAQRGFILTREDRFLQRFHERRDEVSELIANLSELTSDNQSQASRLDELRHHFNDFSGKLEQRAQTITISTTSKIIMDDLETVDGIKDNILRINSDILQEEYGLLNAWVKDVEIQKSRYFTTLLVGIISTSAILLLFNGFLLNVQRKRNHIEASLKDTEERFSLAVEGTRDGIFDWDLQSGKVFYSRQFFMMLGYEREALVGTVEDFKSLLHPEDVGRVSRYIEEYLDHKIEEYSQDFRLKSQNGSWVWINARAKAIFNAAGKPVRMVGAHTDITHIKESEERLKAEKIQAEEASRAKSDFLAHMSHEIRTPLTAISGIAEIFGNKQHNLDDKQKNLIHTLHNSVGVLKDLINDILDFSKIECGELELDEKLFDLRQLFESIVNMMAVRANEKGLSFVFDYEGVKDKNFHGDVVRLRQILTNLIGNALKFTEKGGVTVKAYTEMRDHEPFLYVDIIDTGIGISSENFDLVFERFKQADATVSRKYGGTGLGLPISRNLARLMGGDIVLSSEVGKGSTFSIRLPLKMIRGEDGRDSGNNTDKTPPGHRPGDPVNGSEILMVEDYEGNIVVIGYILDEMGFRYDVARTGQEALDFWGNKHYDLILMDIQMPVMDGFTATKAIRKYESEKNRGHTPIVGMTAHALVGDKDKCIAAGMDAYLPKPIVEDNLKKQILKYLAEGRMNQNPALKRAGFSGG